MGAVIPVIQAGSGEGDGGKRICWMGTPWDGGDAVGVGCGTVPSKGIPYWYVVMVAGDGRGGGGGTGGSCGCGAYDPARKDRMPATACPRSMIAAVICFGVKTIEAVANGAVSTPEVACAPGSGAPVEGGGGAPVVWGSVAAGDGGGGWVVGGEEEDMIEPEIPDTRLIGIGSLPRRGRRL